MMQTFREIHAIIRFGHALLSVRYYRWALDSASIGLEKAMLAAKQAHTELVLHHELFPTAQSIPLSLRREDARPAD